MKWKELLDAYSTSTKLPILKEAIITCDGTSKDKDGFFIDTSRDFHSIHIKLPGDLDKYTVGIRIDKDNNVTASIEIKDVGPFNFPVTGEEPFDERVKMTPWLTEFRKDKKSLSDLKKIFDWINDVYKEVLQNET